MSAGRTRPLQSKLRAGCGGAIGWHGGNAVHPSPAPGLLVAGGKRPQMKNREAIARLRQAGLPSSQIAELLGVSKQYVSRVCRMSGIGCPCAKRPGKKVSVGVRDASRLLGVSPRTVRLWSDQGKVPSWRVAGGRGDRRFQVTDLWSFVAGNETDTAGGLDSGWSGLKDAVK